MFTRALRAIAPEKGETLSDRLAIAVRRESLPIPFVEGFGDYACGHCGLVLLRGQRVVLDPAWRVVTPRHHEGQAQLLCCPACDWYDELPLS